ncbi:hypothetical protein CRUP_028847 [Coryphaenoides rupestris]|nr:hypothetical protein CRUP_028847 [Coryphaenoides rupestris]
MKPLSVSDGRVLEGLQRYSSLPTYLPVNYQVLGAESAFFLKEANQEFMRNSSLLSRTEPFFIYQARGLPSINASYGPLSVEHSVQTFILNSRVHLAKPRVQVLFYIAGRDWDDYTAIDKLPCVHMFAFHETQEVRGSCQLRGELGLCTTALEPLAGWFSPPSVVPGRQRGAADASEGTSVELYYVLQSAETGECHSEESRKDSFIRSSQEGLFGSYTSTPLRRIGSVRLYQSPSPPPLVEHRLDGNFVVMVPAAPIKPRDSVSAFVCVSAYSSVQMFTLRATPSTHPLPTPRPPPPTLAPHAHHPSRIHKLSSTIAFIGKTRARPRRAWAPRGGARGWVLPWRRLRAEPTG